MGSPRKNLIRNCLILGMALKTVKKRLQRVYKKLGVETRTAAGLRASEILNRHRMD